MPEPCVAPCDKPVKNQQPTPVFVCGSNAEEVPQIDIETHEECRDGILFIVTTVYTDGVAGTPSEIDTGYECDPTQEQYDLEKIEKCVDGLKVIEICRFVTDENGITTKDVFETVDTGEPCVPEKQEVEVDTCDGVETVEVDSVVKVEGVQTVKMCPDPVIETTVDYECNEATGFLQQIATVTADGVVADPVITDTTTECVAIDDSKDFEQIKRCNADGVYEIVTTVFLQDETSTEIVVVTEEECLAPNDYIEKCFVIAGGEEETQGTEAATWVLTTGELEIDNVGGNQNGGGPFVNAITGNRIEYSTDGVNFDIWQNVMPGGAAGVVSTDPLYVRDGAGTTPILIDITAFTGGGNSTYTATATIVQEEQTFTCREYLDGTSVCYDSMGNEVAFSDEWEQVECCNKVCIDQPLEILNPNDIVSKKCFEKDSEFFDTLISIDSGNRPLEDNIEVTPDKDGTLTEIRLRVDNRHPFNGANSIHDTITFTIDGQPLTISQNLNYFPGNTLGIQIDDAWPGISEYRFENLSIPIVAGQTYVIAASLANGPDPLIGWQQQANAGNVNGQIAYVGAQDGNYPALHWIEDGTDSFCEVTYADDSVVYLDALSNEIEEIPSDTDQVPCENVKQTVTVDTCDGVASVDVDSVVKVEGVITTKECPADVIETLVDYECNEVTGFVQSVTTVITNGVAAEPVFADTTTECVAADLSKDFEQVKVCNMDTGFYEIFTTIFLQDETSTTDTVETTEECGCEGTPECVESQEWTYGIDNTGTTTNEDATVTIALSDGSTIVIDQTNQGSAGQWTPQMAEWGANIQAAADAAGLAWFVETRYMSTDGTSLVGGGGFAGPPSLSVSKALFDGGMRARYVNIQICPGQPVPVSATYDSVSRPNKAMTTAGAVLGPIQKFVVCRCCGEAPVWYLEDGVTPAEVGQIPNCYEPCGTLALTSAPPDRDCEFFFDLACDNNNQTDPAQFTNQITRRATVCSGEQIALDYFEEDPNDPTALIDYTLVGDFVDCDSGEPIELPTPPCSDFVTETLFSMSELSGALRNREWDLGPRPAETMTEEAGSLIRESFDFSAPTAIDAPSTLGLNVNDTNGSSTIQDAQVIEGYIVVDAPIKIRWSGTSLGYFAAELGECCGPLELRVEGASGESTVAPTDELDLNSGIHQIRLWNIDDYSNTSRATQYSLDGGVTWTTDATPPGITMTNTKPYETCKKVKVCKDSGAILDLLTGAVIDPSDCYGCSKSCTPNSNAGLADILSAIIGDEGEGCPCDTDSCDYTTEFKSSGITSLLTANGEAVTSGPHDFTGLTAGQNASNDPAMAAAEADINAYLANNGGGTVTLEYLSQSILTVTVTGSSVEILSADDDSNPGPHAMTSSCA